MDQTLSDTFERMLLVNTLQKQVLRQSVQFRHEIYNSRLKSIPMICILVLKLFCLSCSYLRYMCIH